MFALPALLGARLWRSQTKSGAAVLPLPVSRLTGFLEWLRLKFR